MSTTRSTTRCDDLSQQRARARLPQGQGAQALVMQQVGRDAVIEEALRDHLSGWYRGPSPWSGIDPVDRPDHRLVATSPPRARRSRFTAEVEVKAAARGQVLQGADGVRRPSRCPREAVDGELERLRLTVAELNPVERGAQDGDFVGDRLRGLDGRHAVRGRQRHRLRRRAGRRAGWSDDLENGLVGMKAGERARRRRAPSRRTTRPSTWPASTSASTSR